MLKIKISKKEINFFRISIQNYPKLAIYFRIFIKFGLKSYCNGFPIQTNVSRLCGKLFNVVISLISQYNFLLSSYNMGLSLMITPYISIIFLLFIK